MPYVPLSDGEVLEGVRTLVSQGRISWKYHAKLRMAERGYEPGEIRQCLLSGHFVEGPVIPNRAGDVQYEFKMRATVDSVAIDVVASLVPESKVVVISVIDPNSRS